jgi:hypothetical protein
MMAPASDVTDGHTRTALLRGTKQWTISLLFAEEDPGTVTARPQGAKLAQSCEVVLDCDCGHESSFL